MSAKIEQILEVMDRTNRYRKGSVSSKAIQMARQKAVIDVTKKRNIKSPTVLDKLIRKLRPEVSSVDEFDTVLIAYLTKGSAKLRKVLLKHSVGADDRERIFRFFGASPIAVDVAEPPGRVQSTVYRTIRDTNITRQVKGTYNHRCQLCKESLMIGQGRRYAEAHHIKPLCKGGLDIVENILCLCPNHHAILDYGGMRLCKSDFKLLAHDVSDKFIRYHNTKMFKE